MLLSSIGNFPKQQVDKGYSSNAREPYLKYNQALLSCQGFFPPHLLAKEFFGIVWYNGIAL
jgi:hypothetical protein